MIESMFGGTDSEAERVTGIGPAGSLGPNEILRDVERAMDGQGYLEWVRYSHAAELHRRLDAEVQASDFLKDAFVQCAARLGAAQRLSQVLAEHHLMCALALRDRLPQVALALKDGVVAAHHIAAIVSRTDLIEGTDHAADIDREIAANLRRRGSWSKKAMRDMVDATIFRRDPDLVREERKDAHNNRGVWADGKQNGMGELTAVLSAEHTAMIMARLEKLADSTCRRDPRRKPQRMSDALFAITMARAFTCQCDQDDDHPCAATILTVPADGMFSGIDAKIVLHAIANQSTLDGDNEQPGYLEGHGVIGADHARDLTEQDTTLTRPMGNTTAPVPEPEPEPEAVPEPGPEPEPEPDASVEGALSQRQSSSCESPAPNRKTRRAGKKTARNKTAMMAAPPDPRLTGIGTDDRARATEPVVQVIPLPAVQPGDHYRPSAVLDAFIRIRDCYCTWPGCDAPAWNADLDHTTEYNHHNPAAGGRTHPAGMKALCRFHHMVKTHSDWLDDQYIDRDGRTRTIVITPEGRRYHGPAWTGEDLFPALHKIVWDNNSPPTRTRTRTPHADTAPRSRTVAKHQRRQQERHRNRLRRESADDSDAH